MLKLAAQSNYRPVGVAPPPVKAALFDITFVSTVVLNGTSGDSGQPASLLIQGLRSQNRRTALLRYSSLRQTGLIAMEGGAHVGADNGCYASIIPDRVFYASAKLLCLDSQLFNLKGGSEFARMSVSTAKRAGRLTALLCADLPTAFLKRREIVDSVGGNLDYVVGEPPAVLSLFGLSRVDTLVPRLIALGTGLVLHRVDSPSISLRAKSGTIAAGGAAISKKVFWSQFVPSQFGEFLASPTA
jgi:hypothetical protein